MPGCFAGDDGNPDDEVLDDVGGSEGGGSIVACAGDVLPLPVPYRLASVVLGVAILAPVQCPCPLTA